MSRPTFELTDEQARQLVARVHALQASCPASTRTHRPFVRGFVRAVYDVCGQLLSATLYRRLLRAYAPERRPSTLVLDDEKRQLARELSVSPTASALEHESTRINLVALMREVLAEGATSAYPDRPRSPASSMSGMEAAFLQSRLQETESALREARAAIGQLTAELAVCRHSTVQAEASLATANATLQQQASALHDMAATIDDFRKLTMQTLDQVRGETRIWKERAQQLDQLRRQDERLLETFRQLAYRHGAAIPAGLSPGVSSAKSSAASSGSAS